jgi:hypothetical protein
MAGAERCGAGSIYADASGPCDIHLGDIHLGDIHLGDIHLGDIHVGDIHVARAAHHPRAAGGAIIEAAAESLRLPG